MIHQKKIIISFLIIMMSLNGMEKKESDVCNLEHISTIPVEQLVADPERSLQTVLHCSNVQEILVYFNKKVQGSGNSNFAHRYNEFKSKKTNSARNYFLETLIEHKQY